MPPHLPAKQRLLLAILVLSALLSPALHSRAEEPQPPGGQEKTIDNKTAVGPALLPIEVQEPLQHAQRLLEQSQRSAATGRADEAIAAARKALAIQRETLGNDHDAVADSLEYLAGLHEQRRDLASARQAQQEALAIRRKLHGQTHWRTTQARLGLERLALLETLTPEQQGRLEEANRAHREAMRLYQAARYQEALPILEQVLATRRAIYGEEHPESNDTLLHLAVLHERTGDYATAAELSRRACEVSLKTVGENHPNYASALSILALMYQSMGAYGKAEPLYQQALEIMRNAFGERDVRYASGLLHLARLYAAMGQYAPAEPLYQQALEILRNALGDSHPEYATALSNLGLLYYSMGAYTKAEPLYRQSVTIIAQSHGQHHPAYAFSLNMLAGLYQAMGDYAEAEPLFRQAVEIAEKTIGKTHPHYATFLNNLALVYHAAGAYAKAEPLFRQAWRISRQSVGEQHPESARILANLANVYEAMGDYEKAEPLYRQALDIRKDILDDDHPEYAASLFTVAALYKQMGDYRRAERLCREATEAWRNTLGEQHPTYATGLDNLAALHAAMGDDAQAESLYEQALEIRREALGERHADFATSLSNLAGLYHATGRYAEAEPLFESASAIRAETLGQGHPSHAASLANLASLYLAAGQYAKAEPLLRQVLEMLDGHREATFAVQNERQRIALVQMLRTALDGWLSAASRTDVPDDQIYNRLLRWKGTVFARQREERLALDHPELQPLVDQLRSVRSRWATLALATPEAPQREPWREQVAQLQGRKEELESELARRSGEQRQARSLDELTAGELARRLPEQTAFVDFLQYTDFRRLENGRPEAEARLLAFVTRRGRPPIRVDFGRAEPIGRAVDRWRDAFGHAASPLTDPHTRVQEELVERIWQPLATPLSGADTLLIAPDGPLCRIPLAALPGQDPDSYLIEQFAVGYVTSGRQLAEVLEEGRPAASGGLLLVGGIDYQSAAAEPVVALPMALRLLAVPIDAQTRSGFEPLPGTEIEVQAIARMAEETKATADLLVLSQAAPSEARLKKELSSRRWRYVHLATHGFFAPPFEPSPEAVLPDRNLLTTGEWDVHQPLVSNPQLLSGLVLAGAARADASEGEDGILTAAEVENLDLRGTELVVLSACQTGLGAVAGGEGALGLQRAFHLAAAETLIASLWRVDDAATSLLMETFYRNLWEKGLPRLEALRQAQLFVLNHPDQVEARRATLAQEMVARGVDLAVIKALPGEALPPEEAPRRSPPALWAPFLLSGQWR